MAISLSFPLPNGYLASFVSVYNLLVSRMISHSRWARPMTYMANHLGRFLCLALIGKLPLVLMLRRGKQVCGENSIAFKPAVPGAKVTSPEVYELSLLVGSTTLSLLYSLNRGSSLVVTNVLTASSNRHQIALLSPGHHLMFC
jgi:hypothetical protein